VENYLPRGGAHEYKEENLVTGFPWYQKVPEIADRQEMSGSAVTWHSLAIKKTRIVSSLDKEKRKEKVRLKCKRKIKYRDETNNNKTVEAAVGRKSVREALESQEWVGSEIVTISMG
jgi:hypothetical protein